MDTNTNEISNFGTYGKVSYVIPEGTDLNTLINAGIYMGYNLVNAPWNDWFHIEVIRFDDAWTVQKAYEFANETCPVFIRTQVKGTWNAWRLFNPGTANTGQVLAGYTFSSANGVNLTGSMVNRDPYTPAVSIGDDGTLFHIRIPQGAYITNTVTGYPVITFGRELFAGTGAGLRIPYYKSYAGEVNGFFNTETITITEKGRYIAVFGGSYGYKNSQINGWGHVYSPSHNYTLPEFAKIGGCAVSNGGGFVTITQPFDGSVNMTVCGTLNNSYGDTNIGNGFANLFFCVIGL